MSCGVGDAPDAPSSVDRIRELESQLADLRSRRDITGLSKEEFEILATETAMAMIKSAQARESKAQSISSRLVASVNSSTAITVQQRTDAMIAPGTYTSAVYAYVDAGTTVILKHVDLFIMGNLV